MIIRNSVKAACLGLVLVACAGGLTACSNNKSAENEAACKAVKPGTVTTANKMCVVNNDDPVDPAVAPVTWKGQKIGFCCPGCKPQWNKMTDAQKDAAVAKVTSAK